MVDANSLIEGHCKFRDGKKWKTRWAVVTKLSPVADCLQLQIYRDEKERARNGHTKASLSLQAFLALESGFTLDKESHTLAIICQDLCVVLAFDNRERLIQWTVRIANNLGEGQQFLVQLASVPAKSKLTPGPVKLHVTDRKFCLTGGIPPRLLGHWEVPHLRRYGIVDGRLVFEGGSRCGKGEGVHVLVPDPPQISLIIDALDMSSKGQLVRGPSRRFGSAVTDSPRKSLSRLSELRSSVQNEPVITPVAIPAANMAIAATMSPTPRESRSAEALCNACNDNSIVGHPGGSMWMSSEASSRCDLDSCDNISVISPEDMNNLQEQHNMHTHPKHPASPARTPAQGQPLQIAKPMPSSMERCLSCMSKLGQQGQDILSPSWTMDLSVTTTGNTTTAPPLSSTSTNNGPQGSIGSGNSDRLSISSHGSSGGVTEYYYDTPRSVLVAEARRNAAVRAGTPPGVFQNGQMIHATGGCNTTSHHPGSTGSGGSCSSPYRNPRSNHGGCSTTNGFTQSVTGQQGATVANSCPSGCHCQNHQRVMNNSAAGHGNSPIYYNGVAEQKAHGGKPPINLHTTTASGSNGAAGPYENYDFPRCTHPISFTPTVAHSNSSSGCCPGEHTACGHSGGIDWSKKPPMDRSSIASTAMGSDQTSEFYDTPPTRHSCTCCAPPSCSCCVSGIGSPGAAAHHHSHGHSAPHSHYQSPACLVGHSDPMENYDVPPLHPHGGITATAAKELHGVPHVARSVNGEGKMPLVSGALPPRTASNAHAIYAQVDKTKKTPRQVPMPQQHFMSCDNSHQHQPIYENHGNSNQCQQQQQTIAQPTYANVSSPPCKVHNSNQLKGKPPAPEPVLNSQSHNCPSKSNHHHNGTASNPANNYVNLEFAGSLLLYENAQEIRQEAVTIPAQNPDNNTPTTLSKEKPASADLVATSKNDTQTSSGTMSSTGEVTKTCSDELTSIPEEKDIKETKENEQVKENEYENTRELSKNDLCKKQDEMETKQNENNGNSDPPSVQEDPSVSETAEVTASTSSKDNDNEEPSLPLRRSSSVPCKGGHANRGSASSSDSGVSGDGGLFFDDSSPLNDVGSLCLHESLPRKSQRGSPGVSAKNTSATATPKPQEEEQTEEMEKDNAKTSGEETVVINAPEMDPLLNRHYETIDESKASNNLVVSTQERATVVVTAQPMTNPVVAAVKSTEAACTVQRPKNPLTLVSDANSTSSGASDMSDYIETLSSCSRGSNETVTSIPVNSMDSSSSNNISGSPRKSSNMKPRSGKEYFKIDRSMFKSN